MRLHRETPQGESTASLESVSGEKNAADAQGEGIGRAKMSCAKVGNIYKVVPSCGGLCTKMASRLSAMSLLEPSHSLAP